MEEVLKVGMLGCTITVAYLGYCQIRSFFDAITSKQEFTSDRSCDGDVILNNAEQPCQHDWSTCLTDLSGHNWYDEVVEAEDEYIKGQVHYRCERCGLENGHRSIRITNIRSIGYGNKSLAGRLSLEEFCRRILDQLKHLQ
jgi:hypothetical protein